MSLDYLNMQAFDACLLRPMVLVVPQTLISLLESSSTVGLGGWRSLFGALLGPWPMGMGEPHEDRFG